MRAKDLAKIHLDDLTFSVVDVETTGMSAQFNRVMDFVILGLWNSSNQKR